jgi:serine phosphatase RsbU (regulator of sigma subunit)
LTEPGIWTLAVTPRAAALTLAALAIVIAVTASVLTGVERRRHRRARDLLRRRLDLALVAGEMGTWLWDASSGRLVWDDHLEELYGCDAPSSVQAWVDAIDESDRDTVRQAVGEGIAAGDRFQVVHRRALPDSEPRWLELRGEPVHDHAGRLLGTAGVVVDVTEDRLHAEELAVTRQTLEELLDLAPGFSSDVPPGEVPGRVCEAGAALFGADACGIWILEDETARHLESYPPGFGLPIPALPLADLVELRERLGDRSLALLSSDGPHDPRLTALMREVGMRSGVVAPVPIESDAPMFLTLWWRREDDPLGLRQLAVLRRFTDQAALALEQARTRAARDEVDALSESLQAGLLPVPVVRDPSVSVEARYRPGEQRILLGGDFYDVVERPDGSLAFLIGDVTGHGPRPAAIGAALRAAWRALALTSSDPVGWLRAMATSLASYGAGPEVLVTVCTGTIAPDRTRCTIALAGHPPPVLLGDGVGPLGATSGLPLGVAAEPAPVASDVALGDRWGLLLYTDGVIETRAAPGSSERLGEQGLMSWMRRQEPGISPGRLLDALLTDLEEIGGGPPADDVAVVLIARR